MKKIISIIVISTLGSLHAQDTAKKTKSLGVSGYLETYYSYDLGNPADHRRPAFFYSFNRHNEVNLNLGFLKATYLTSSVRANLALMAGTYAQYNLAGEQGLLRNILEGNAGIRLSKKSDLWLDAGVMPSHIGFENAIGQLNWNLTRSILADNSPYYESGVKLGYTTGNEKLYLAVMYLNGWQRIQRRPANQTPAFGTQLTIKPDSQITLNWSTFVGNDLPDSVRQWRYFNNIYGRFQLSKRFGLTVGFDIGMQQQKKDTSAYNIWYSPVLILRYSPAEKIRIASRVEYYKDEKGVIISTGTLNGFQTIGHSLNLDYLPLPNIMCRLEGRMLSSKDKLFVLDNRSSHENYFITGSIAVSF